MRTAARRGPYGEIVAPPSFAVTFRNGRHFFENVPRFGMRGFDAGKDVEFVAPIRPGDNVTLSSHVKEIYEKTGRTRHDGVRRNPLDAENQNGEVLAAHRPSLHEPSLSAPYREVGSSEQF